MDLTDDQMRERAEGIDGARYFELDAVAWGRFNDRSRETLVAMTPDDFLAMAAPMQGHPEAPEGTPAYNVDKMERVVGMLEKGKRFSDLPYLLLGPAGGVRSRLGDGIPGVSKIHGHEGRHRAMALRDLGVERIPVVLASDNHRWGQPAGGFNGDRPVKIEGEDGWVWTVKRDWGWDQRKEARDRQMRTPASLFYGSPETRNNGSSAQRDDPALWERVKAEVTAGDKGGRPGQWSARKAQMAVRLYKERGGGYVGPRDPDNSLTRWTEQDWRTRSGEPSLVTGERYLPADALDALTDEEYAATTRAKRAGMLRGEQFVDQPPRIARKTAKHRRNR